MKKTYVILFFIIIYSVLPAQKLNRTVTQISTIDALLTGIFDGEVPIGKLKKYGNFGIGTFNNVDGEMVICDGKCYQIRSDGSVKESSDTTKTPFSTVAFFNGAKKISLDRKFDLKSFESIIDSIIPTKNVFYGIMIKGKFKTLKARSVVRQQKPFKPLTEVVKSQGVFNFENVDGKLIGFRCPSFVQGINVPGYHLHFLSNDKKAGGHVLNFEIENAELYIVKYSDFRMLLPGDKDFYNTDFSKDRKEQLIKVEK
jgi:acetolactate decarboxylase